MLAWVAVTAAVLAGLAYSTWRHPYRACPSCNGTGNHKGAVWSASSGKCWHCGGTGNKTRLAVRLLRQGTAKAIKSGQHGRNY